MIGNKKPHAAQINRNDFAGSHEQVNGHDKTGGEKGRKVIGVDVLLESQARIDTTRPSDLGQPARQIKPHNHEHHSNGIASHRPNEIAAVGHRIPDRQRPDAQLENRQGSDE
ncbi:MAG: hypothetical protein IPK83_06795 [Planctomycetes bacterium]|nr:hypothetical protein [Planctomycetota bacterium]